MSYYDNVKDDIKKKGEGDTNEASCDTLKEAAQEEKSEEEKANDTPIEVLEEGGLRQQDKKEEGSKDEQRESREKKSSEPSGNPLNDSSENPEIEQKLERIIEQNDRMIEILESFAS